MNPLSKAVQIVVIWHGGHKLNELILVDQLASSGVEYNLARGFPRHGEAEGWIIRPTDIKSRSAESSRTLKARFENFVI
jgi:hypothetical protein